MAKKTFFQKNWTIYLGIGLFVLSVLLGSLYAQSGYKQAVRDATLALLLSLLVKVIVRIHNYQDKIEEQKDTIGKYTKLISKFPKITETIDLTYEVNDRKDRFYDFFLSTVSDQYNVSLRTIQQGKYKCSANNELEVTKKVLECCENNLKAISYLDEEWWFSNQGTLYMNAHEKYIDRKKEKATRIFLMEKENVDKFKSVFQKHKELEIETHIIYTDVDKIEKKYKVDFVIYDDYILRKASEDMNDEGGKKAIFTTETSEVQKYLNYFDNILTIAKDKKNKIPLD